MILVFLRKPFRAWRESIRTGGVEVEQDWRHGCEATILRSTCSPELCPNECVDTQSVILAQSKELQDSAGGMRQGCESTLFVGLPQPRLHAARTRQYYVHQQMCRSIF